MGEGAKGVTGFTGFASFTSSAPEISMVGRSFYVISILNVFARTQHPTAFWAGVLGLGLAPCRNGNKRF